MIKKEEIGGIIIMKGDYGLTNEWIRELQRVSPTPLFVSTDGEWGINMRIANTTKFPYALTLGALTDDQAIFNMGKAIANDCKKLGIHINFAPVADVNTNPKNPVINYRSFGENKVKVSAKAIQYALGMQSQGVMACAKHFPGHGDTDVDSHFDLPTINKPKDALKEMELYPFQQMIQSNIWSMMVAHLKIPSLDPTGTTASLSKPIITDLLKKEMGFEGLVFSDALNMKGAGKSSAGSMELEAYKAGNDILLMSENTESAIKKIEQYIKSNSEFYTDLSNRVFKILLFKHKLKTYVLPDPAYSPEESSNQTMSEDLHKKAITMISSEYSSVEPLIQSGKQVLMISISDQHTGFKKSMEQFSNLAFSRLGKNATKEEFNQLVRGADNYDQVIVAYHDLSQNSKSNFGLTANVIEFIEAINLKSKVLHVWFGNPYALQYFQNAKNIMIAYEDNPKSYLGAFHYFNSNQPCPGKLPVSVGRFSEGNSYLPSQASNRTERIIKLAGTPDQIETKQTILQRIDNTVQDMISNSAAPGCQIAVYHKGKEIFNKSYGRHTYSETSPEVKPSDLYDLASVSKILGTTMACMRLKDEGKLAISDRVGDILVLDDSSTINDITVRQLLTHEAGLTPFIPFYSRFNDSNYFEYFRFKRTGNFNTEVAENLFVRDDFKDSMWFETSHSTRKNVGNYKYSDLSMYILQKVIEEVIDMPLDDYMSKYFYQPMGLKLTYNPSRKYSKNKIVPTEYDAKFRQQQVQGYVHDQGCSLYGGVCGHAGLFGNAGDVAKLMQMLLNGGKFNKKSLIQQSTITNFTAQQSFNSRRGLGFDKPNVDDNSITPTASDCSFATFGHTGFTGTCAWADPFSELVFVFLSNRIYPDADNKKLIRGQYREKIQSLFYQYVR